MASESASGATGKLPNESASGRPEMLVFGESRSKLLALLGSSSSGQPYAVFAGPVCLAGLWKSRNE